MLLYCVVTEILTHTHRGERRIDVFPLEITSYYHCERSHWTAGARAVRPASFAQDRLSPRQEPLTKSRGQMAAGYCPHTNSAFLKTPTKDSIYNYITVDWSCNVALSVEMLDISLPY